MIAGDADVPPSALITAPGTGWAALTENQVNNSGGSIGCGGGGSGWLCTENSTVNNGATLPHTGTYVWEFHYATTQALDLTSLGSALKVGFSSGGTNKVGGIVSEGITLQSCVVGCGVINPLGGGDTPEPASIVLLGSLLGFTTLALRKKFRKA